MTAKYLWIAGSLVLIVMGTAHLLYMFFTEKLSPGNKNVIEEMKSSYLNLTKETTLWKAWIGFNASHSSGVLFIGSINFYFALNYFTILQSDYFYFLLNILTVGFYVWLSKEYWFKRPFIGVLIVLILYSISYFFILIK